MRAAGRSLLRPLSATDRSTRSTGGVDATENELIIGLSVVTEALAESDLKTIVTGLQFPESPRWHDGHLYMSDIAARRVLRVDESGTHVITETPNRPSGLGWMTDGRMVVVSMEDCRLIRLDDGKLTAYADLSPLARGSCNDMVVGPDGRAYVGEIGYDPWHGAPIRPGALLLVQPDGSSRVVADDVATPNGLLISPDRGTLIAAETHGDRLTAWDIGADGSLDRRRLFAALPGGPDGICLDAGGAVWVAIPTLGEVVRVEDGGRITHTLHTGDHVAACMLGGHDRRTLFVCSGRPEFSKVVEEGRVRAIGVRIPGAGWL
jgi:sugar lactone lactonase YvrE